MSNYYVIRAFMHRCRFLLYLQVNKQTGCSRFIAKCIKNRQIEKIELSATAEKNVLAEIEKKSCMNIRYGCTMQTVDVSNRTKEFIDSCWSELKKLRPQFCIE